MKKERISVITLSYNNLEYYKECLKSITQQNYKDIEWILCDDYSDEFAKYESSIKEFLENNTGNIKNYVIHHNERNIGVVKNYKQAIDMATGEYIFYLAIDDMFYDETVLGDVEKYFVDTGLQIFTGFREMFYEDGRRKKLPYSYEVELLKNGSIEDVFRKAIRLGLIAGACTPFRKELVDKYGFLEEGYMHLEDWPRYLYLMKNGVRIGFIDRCLIKYRAGGITGEHKSDAIKKDIRKVLNEYLRPPYSDIENAMKNKKYIIAWGCSGGFLKYYEKWEEIFQRKIDFIVDKDEKKWGSEVVGKQVFSPEKILELQKEDVFVLVFSQMYYVEIAKELEQMGLTEGQEFDLLYDNTVIWGEGK